MRSRPRAALLHAVGAAAACALVLTAAAADAAVPSPAVDVTAAHDGASRYVVVLRDDVTDVRGVAASHAADSGAAPTHTYSHALKGYAAALTRSGVAALRRDPRVAFVSEDTVVRATADAVAVGDEVPVGVRRIAAASTTSVKGPSTVNVAVIDTGVDLRHPDLDVVGGKNCVRPGASAHDDNGHGTHVAGTIAAKNDGAGVVGVAAGTKIYAVKVLNKQGSGTLSSVVCGIDWVTANSRALGIGVANMSLGGSGTDDGNCGRTGHDAEHWAICRSTAEGVTYVVAAGNEAADVAGTVPASYSEVLTVTAMTDSDGAPGGRGAAPGCRTSERDDAYASFSNYATATSDSAHTIAAPGVCVRSTWKGGGYTTLSGTSMATPHVAGSVALCLGSGGRAGPCAGLSPAQIVARLRSDAGAHASVDNGFLGDPSQPVPGKAFGHLTWDGGY